MPSNQKYSSNKIKSSKALIVFVRYPEAGKVKTRLAKGTNKDFANRVYIQCVEKIFEELNPLKDIKKYIFYSEEKDKEKIIEWTDNKYFYVSQQGKNLGERMFNAFEFVCSQNNQEAIIIGTDIPDLSKEIILEAFNELDKNDIVVGPSHDGGYYLLGMKKVYGDLFEDIEWSSNSVFSNTLNKAKALNLTIKELQLLRDIDTKEELDAWIMKTKNVELKKEILSLLKTESN